MTADVGSAAALHVARSETYYFDGWRFDEHDGRIVRDDTEVSLRPKTAGVLRALLARAGEVVAKPELLEEVWGSAATGDDVLAVCVNELRRLLGDDSHRPRYIATAHRRGYRFIAPVSQSPAHPRGPVRLLVGRERELAILRNWWETACGDRRVVGFVTGAPGIGRTALVRAFATEVRIAGEVVFGEGRCIERIAGREPYSPFLDALNGMCRGAGGHRVREVLWHHAPSWLLQLPGLLGDEEAAQLRARVGEHASRMPFGPMLREFSDAMRVLGGDAPVLLVCEDLHAGDRASVDLVASIADGDTGGRMLMLVTYRESDRVAGCWIADAVRDLRTRGVARSVELGPLDQLAATAYLEHRLGRLADTVRVEALARRAEGNPRLLAMLVERELADDTDPSGADAAAYVPPHGSAARVRPHGPRVDPR